jgi:hypothetical protein
MHARRKIAIIMVKILGTTVQSVGAGAGDLYSMMVSSNHLIRH